MNYYSYNFFADTDISSEEGNSVIAVPEQVIDIFSQPRASQELLKLVKSVCGTDYGSTSEGEATADTDYGTHEEFVDEIFKSYQCHNTMSERESFKYYMTQAKRTIFESIDDSVDLSYNMTDTYAGNIVRNLSL